MGEPERKGVVPEGAVAKADDGPVHKLHVVVVVLEERCIDSNQRHVLRVRKRLRVRVRVRVHKRVCVLRVLCVCASA